ncbi:50S ribosomal protein L5 [Paenibacillus sp. GCM10012307]|uniref:50S ribosomal protein L5 n=1 Tax=Paenibacillus roseus TaxID=2798579 RepID=A0A934MUB8_9BACL|nr:50S ribosomal protein L5 [Paenibacillus roseus]MBJ6360927.1 50S ribosomal protein L5 [Paenibacillus roseus]
MSYNNKNNNKGSLYQNNDNILQKKTIINFVNKFTKNIEKIVVHCGIGCLKEVPDDVIDFFFQQLILITGQKPKVKYAKKPIAGFHLRENTPLGLFTTLRKKYMFSFFTRLIAIILPQNYEFRGFSQKQFDGHGNFTIPIKSIFDFRECDPKKYYKYAKIGLNISIVTNFQTNEEAFTLLREYGLLVEK